jgi:hypothetical protein
MGLFTRMKNPVRGTAKVADIVGGLPRSGTSSVLATGEMRLVVTADGIEPTPVTWKGQVRCSRCPVQGDTIPVTFDRTNPQKLKIEWSEMPKLEERKEEAADQRQRKVLDEMRHHDDSTF